MYLIDTNIFLELLLEQIKAKEVEHFLKKVDTPILIYLNLQFIQWVLFYSD